MGPSTPLSEAIAAVLGLAAADQQRVIAARLRARADEHAREYGSHSQAAWALNAFALELEEEITPAPGQFTGWTDTRGYSDDDLEAIADDCVSRWHDSRGGGVALHEFLGLTQAEYAQWVTRPCVADILRTRSKG